MRFVRFTTKTLETFATTRRRVKRLVAEVSTGGSSSTTRDNTILPLALYEGDVADDRPIDCDRGHMIALEFGGPEASDNLVPMYGGFNSGGAWRTFERELDGFAGVKNGQGVGTIVVDITCDYSTVATDDARIPTSFTIAAGAPTATTPERTWTIAHPRPVPVLSPVDAHNRDLSVDARTRMNHAGWLIEENIGDLSSWPSYRRLPQFPTVANRNASHTERPYGFLDFIDWFAVKDDRSALTNWQNQIILSSTSEFPTPKIAKILEANRALNGGGLLSDDPTDVAYTQLKYRVIGWPAGTLVPGSRDLAPEVDHIIPRSMTGTSTYSNAQVLSGKHNNNKRAQVTAQQLQQLSNVIRGTGRSRTPHQDKMEAAEAALLSVMKSKIARDQHWVVDYEVRNALAWFRNTHVRPLALKTAYSRRDIEKEAVKALRSFHIGGY